VTELIDNRHRAEEAGPMLRLHEAAGHLIRRAQQRHTTLWTRQFADDLDVTGPQYALISAIAVGEGIDQRTAGERASLDKSSTADVVARLEGRGWLLLARDPDDGRRKVLRLTPLARAALTEVTRRAQLVQEQLLEAVPARQRKSFVDALRLVAYAGDVPPPESPQRAVLPLRDAPGHLIRRAQQVHTVAWGIEVGRTLTAPQYAVLSALWAHPEGIDQSTAGELASLDKSSMADVAQRLVRRGWVARERDGADARRRVLRLTDAVRDELLHLTPAVLRVQERLLAPLSPAQRKAFMKGCHALAYADDPDHAT
jgi:Transcriptional regulators